MSAILNACGNDTGSPSISKAEDNLSNSDGPLIKGCIRQNSCNSVRLSSENVNRSNVISSHAMTTSNMKSTKRRYCLWSIISILAVIGLCNLFLNITVIAVLRISRGMESMEMIPDENLVKFYGKTDLDKVCLESGVCQGYGDEPMEIIGDEGGVEIDVRNRGKDEEAQAGLTILSNGTSMSRLESFEIKDPRTGTPYFSTDFPNFGLPSGVEKIDVKIAETHRITSPFNDSLAVNSDGQVWMYGAEGTTMNSKEIVWNAGSNILLKSDNGNIILDAKDGVTIDVQNIPVAPMFLQSSAGDEQYKVCVCMPQGKLFKVPVRAGIGARSVNCARVSRSPENDPCLR